MSDNSEIDNMAFLDDKKNLILTLCSNFLENKLQELSVENSFSSTDLLILLDDVMTSLYGMISSQLKFISKDMELSPKESYCVSKTIGEFKDSWERRLEKIANKVLRSQSSEKIIFQTFNQIDKEQKSLLSSVFYSLKKCVAN